MTYQKAVNQIQESELPDEVISLCLDIIEDHKSEFEPDMCSACNGTGEGQYDGSTCQTCRGKSEIVNQEEPDYEREAA